MIKRGTSAGLAGLLAAAMLGISGAAQATVVSVPVGPYNVVAVATPFGHTRILAAGITDKTQRPIVIAMATAYPSGEVNLGAGTDTPLPGLQVFAGRAGGYSKVQATDYAATKGAIIQKTPSSVSAGAGVLPTAAVGVSDSHAGNAHHQTIVIVLLGKTHAINH